MIRTERAEGVLCLKINDFEVNSKIRVRTYKHKQKAGRKGKGSRLAAIQSKLENIEEDIQKDAIKYERAAKREAQKAKRKAKRQARKG